MQGARTILGAILLGTAFALSLPGVEVIAACDANAQSCDAAPRAPARSAVAPPSCPAEGAAEAALGAEEAAVARLRRELAAQAGAGPTGFVPLNGRGYNYGPGPSDGAPVLRFETHPTLPPGK